MQYLKNFQGYAPHVPFVTTEATELLGDTDAEIHKTK